jgi:hypothetical protein
MSRSSNVISAAQREKIAEALSRAAAARRRANGATRGLRKMLEGLPPASRAEQAETRAENE